MSENQYLVPYKFMWHSEHLGTVVISDGVHLYLCLQPEL